MKETLICSLDKHNIYYLSDANCSFYILTPYKEFNETNISIRLKSNYQSYDLSRNSIDNVTNELIKILIIIILHLFYLCFMMIYFLELEQLMIWIYIIRWINIWVICLIMLISF